MGSRHRISAAFAKSAPEGKYCDGGGLWLHKRADGGGQWVLRITVHGRRREMGLGGLLDYSLREAREQADQWRSLAKAGTDPIKARDRARRQLARADHTMLSIADEAYEARKAELKDDGRAGRWYSPLKVHVLPKLGGVPITQVDQKDIRDVLTPIWHTKAD